VGIVSVEALLASLSLEEKVGQMLQPERSAISLREIRNYNIGSILNAGGSHPNDDPLSSFNDWHTMTREMQEAALSSSSKIPLLYGIDAVHGNNNVYGATIFPHNINLGMIQDLEVIEAVAKATALEMTALNMHLNFSPSVAIAHNIRWGRTYESMGQTSDIVSSRMQAYLRGVQGIIVPTVKHYVGDGATDQGIDQGNATISEDALRAVHLIPYIDAIAMNVPVIMVSYHSIEGVKMHGNQYYLNDVLKEELGFEGILLSDYNAINQLEGDFKTQLTTAINAGVDMLMQPFNWKEAIELIIIAVNEGDIPMARIDDAVRRILTVKVNHGLFVTPVHPLNESVMYSEAHRQIAFEAASQSMVLLKDDLNQPLDELGTLFLTGPGADHVGLMAGGWTTEWQGNESPRIGVGRSIKEVIEDNHTLASRWQDADTVIVVFAEKSYAEWFGDTPNPSLLDGLAHPDNRAALNIARFAKAQGKNVIGLLISGRPVILGDALDHFDQFVAMFLPGSEGGEAVVSLLNHDVPFTGKLSFYWPISVDSLDYPSVQNQHLFPIGYGLSSNPQE
jgi:beta-glucosidase